MHFSGIDCRCTVASMNEEGKDKTIFLMKLMSNENIIIFSFIQTIRLTNRNRLQCTIMQLKQFTRTQMTEDINLNY